MLGWVLSYQHEQALVGDVGPEVDAVAVVFLEDVLMIRLVEQLERPTHLDRLEPGALIGDVIGDH